jgi:hypothetical protein
MTLDLVDRMYIEVADDDSASRLTHRLARRRTAERLGEPARLVMASFSSDPADLAALLREVESWVDDESLCAIRFLQDDRIYVLEAGEADWPRTRGARCSRPSRRLLPKAPV